MAHAGRKRSGSHVESAARCSAPAELALPACRRARARDRSAQRHRRRKEPSRRRRVARAPYAPPHARAPRARALLPCQTQRTHAQSPKEAQS